MITPLCFQKLQLLQNFAPWIIAAEPRRAKGMTKSVRYEVSLYLSSFSYIFSTTRVKKIVFYTDDSVISGFVISRFHCNQKKKILSWPLDNLFNHRYDIGIQNSTWLCCRFGRSRVRNLIWEVIAYERVQSKTVFEWEGKWLLPPQGFRPKGEIPRRSSRARTYTVSHITNPYLNRTSFTP